MYMNISSHIENSEGGELMNINLIARVQPIDRLPKSKHSTEDPNERRRRQLGLVYGCTHTTFKQVLRNTTEISEEGRVALKQHKGEL